MLTLASPPEFELARERWFFRLCIFCGVVKPKYKAFPCDHAVCCLRCSGDSDLRRCPLCHTRLTMLLRYDARYRPPPEENIQYPSIPRRPFPPSLANYDLHFPPLPPRPPPPPPPPPPPEYEIQNPFPLPPLDDYPRYLGVGQRYRRGPCLFCRVKMAVWFIIPCRHVIFCGICLRRIYGWWKKCPVCSTHGESASRVATFR